MSFLSNCFSCCRSNNGALARRAAAAEAALAATTNHRDQLADNLHVTNLQAQAASRVAGEAIAALQEQKAQTRRLEARVLALEGQLQESHAQIAQLRNAQLPQPQPQLQIQLAQPAAQNPVNVEAGLDPQAQAEAEDDDFAVEDALEAQRQALLEYANSIEQVVDVGSSEDEDAADVEADLQDMNASLQDASLPSLPAFFDDGEQKESVQQRMNRENLAGQGLYS